jgi:hypothetical protein
MELTIYVVFWDSILLRNKNTTTFCRNLLPQVLTMAKITTNVLEQHYQQLYSFTECYT